MMDWLANTILSLSSAVRLPGVYIKVHLLRSGVRDTILHRRTSNRHLFRRLSSDREVGVIATHFALRIHLSPWVSAELSPLLEWMARWGVPGMPAACRMNKHMASLSGDNGEAEGSCPEPAGNRAVVCQSLCNSHLKEALSSPPGLFREQPGWAIIIMGSPGRLGRDRGAVYWGELIDSCLLIWLSLTGKPNDWKSMASEEARTKEGSGGHCTCWAWGRLNRLPRVSPMSSGRSFPTCSSDMALVYRETVLPSACVLHQHSEEGHLEVTSPSILVLTPPRAHLLSHEQVLCILPKRKLEGGSLSGETERPAWSWEIEDVF